MEGVVCLEWPHHDLYPQKKKGVPSAVGFPHCAGSGEGWSLPTEELTKWNEM